MKTIISFATIFLLIIVQSSVFRHLEICNAYPNLILILVLALSVSKDWKNNWIWIIFGGFMLDIFSFNNPIGISILGLFLISYLANFFSHNIFKKTNVFFVILIGIGGTLIYRIVLVLTFLILGITFELSLIQISFQLVYNIIVLVPMFYLIKKLWRT